MNNKLWTLYKHTSPSNKIYIGVTSQSISKRWQNGRGYITQQRFYRAIEKYGWDNFKHEILFTNLTSKEAEQKERELISFYRSNDKRYGYNIDNGGNSIGTVSEERKQKLSLIHKGRKFTPEHIKKLRDAKQGEKHNMYGKHHSEETKAKMRASALGRVISQKQRELTSQRFKGKTGALCSNSKKVAQYTKEGELVCVFAGVAEASRITKINNTTICQVCNGLYGRKTARGYVWKYL